MSAYRKSLLILPLLLLLIFLADKVALIGVVRDQGRAEATPFENLLLNIDAIKRKHTGQKPWIVFFGSSRSEFFSHLHPDTIQAAKLSRAEQGLLERFDFETRLPYKAATSLAGYAFVDRMLRRGGRRPDLIVFEYSPEMLNASGPANPDQFFARNILDQELLLKYFGPSDLFTRSRIILRLAFPSFNYHVRPERILVSLEKPVVDPLLSWIIFNAKQNSIPLPDPYLDFPGDVAFSSDHPDHAEYKKRFIDYSDYLQNDFILRNYEIHPLERELIFSMLARLHLEKTPVLVWTPPLHPELFRRLEATEYGQAGRAIEKKIEETAPYLNLLRDRPPCFRFVDSSHLSARCVPIVTALLMQKAVQSYPELLR